uniref:G_PROTEIN_RECEP_F1_2 domain-containing protein n=1 Tax=Parastrongyloides trichosuri TaxID=131310 RepID=A0A0N4ZLA8_PARTI
MGPSTIDIIFLIFKIISIILYFFVMWFIYRKEMKEDTESNKSFYINFIINGFVDSFDILMMTFLLDVTRWGWFYEYFKYNEEFIRWSPIFSYLPIFWCEMGNLIITFNRFVALNFPFKYKLYWTKKVTIFLILIQFLLPLIVYHYLIGEQTKMNYLEECNCYSLSMASSVISQKNNITATIYTHTVFILTFVMSICNIIKFKKFAKNKHSNKESRTMLPFVLYCSIICFSTLFLALAYTIKMVGTILKSENVRANAQSYVTISMLCMTVIHPYLLLFINGRLRKKFFIYYIPCTRKFFSDEVTIHKTTQQRNADVNRRRTG